MAVSSVASSSTTTSTATVPSDKTGFNALTSGDFLKLLIEELKNQDPTQPVGNDELLRQLSEMRSLQSNIELTDTLKNLSNNQQVTAGAAFLGKVVTGKDANQTEVTGVADRVSVKNGATVIGIGGQEIKLSDVTGVSLAP